MSSKERSLIPIEQKMKLMQEALSSLSLQLQEEVYKICSDGVMLGKVLATRSFTRFTIIEIVHKTWRSKTKIRIEKLDENVFKFTIQFHGLPPVYIHKSTAE